MGILRSISALFSRPRFNEPSRPKHTPAEVAHSVPVQDTPPQLVPYDENLYERSRNQWQFGDWHSLAALSRDTLQHHPNRAKLALLAAAGHMGVGNMAEARAFALLAIDWGCSKALVGQVLISGVHNTLARAAAVNGDLDRSSEHFKASIATGMPSADQRLTSQARANEQLVQLGLATPVIQLANYGERQVYQASNN